MNRFAVSIAVITLAMAGAQILRRYRDRPLVSPAEKRFLRDSLNDDFGRLDVPKPKRPRTFPADSPAPAPAAAAAGRLGSADWGNNPATGQPWTAAALAAKLAPGAPSDGVTAATARVVQVAQQTLGEGVSPVAQLNLQGIVFSDPRFQASQAAVKTLPDIYNWSMCARVAAAPANAACLSKASAAALAWTATYKPTGDPINENVFVPLLLSIDLLGPVVSPDQRSQLLGWVSSLAAAGDALVASWKPTDGRRANNWEAWRLLLRGLAAEFSGDDGLKSSTRQRVTSFAAANILDDGSSIDFRTRDALHYHIYDLTPLVELALYAPDLVDAATDARIEKGLEFLRPFYTGQMEHVEFVHTTVPFDVVRHDAGDPSFAYAPWNPASARGLLRLAVVKYPAIASWAGNVVDPNYSPMVKQLAALHGG